MQARDSVENERRSGVERRRLNVAAYWRGALKPRRRFGRREDDRIYPIVDWHSPRVLALVLLILGLSGFDGVLTVMLLSHGANEVNPVMALFVPHNLGWFAVVKLGLTSLGAVVLVACARMTLFRLFRGEVLLYLVVGCYVALVTYELHLLQQAPLVPL
jgi:hypothetical protein